MENDDSMVEMRSFLIKNDDSMVKMQGLYEKVSKTIWFLSVLISKIKKTYGFWSFFVRAIDFDHTVIIFDQKLTISTILSSFSMGGLGWPGLAGGGVPFLKESEA